MPKTIYCYHPNTGEYVGERAAKESPLDFAQGREVYLIPGNATAEKPPSEISGYVRKWDGAKWVQVQLHKITKTVTKQFFPLTFENEVRAAFPSIDVKIEGEPNSKASRSLVFHNIPDTPENAATLDNVIASHVLPDTKIEQLSNVQLAAFQVLCEEMQKVDAAFPTFEAFSQKVNARVATL